MESATLYDILCLLLAGVILAPLLQRFGIPSVLAYLAAGIILGPHTPGPVIDAESTRPLAEFGVVFLLFAIGLELPLSRLKTMRRYIFGLGSLQVVLTAVPFAAMAHHWAGLPSPIALVAGVTLAMSSTATVLALLVERNEAVDLHGRIAVAVLIFQDLAVIPILTLLPILAENTHDMLPALGLAALKAGGAVLAIFVLGRLLLRPAYGFIAASRNPEVFVASNLLLVLAVAWLTEKAGMSMALGAFLGGLMLADSPYRHQIEADIAPFRGLLLGLFFMTVGLSVNLPVLAGRWMDIGGLVILVLGVKALVILVLARILKVGRADGYRVAFLLAQTGEFTFVVFDHAQTLRLLDPATVQVLFSVTALTMVATPALAHLGRILARRHQAKAALGLAATQAHDHMRDHVVVAGYGRMGRTIGRVLDANGIAFVALDLDSDRVLAAHQDGLPVFFGDAAKAAVLRSVGVEDARAVVITLGSPRATEHAIASLRQIAPKVPVIVRAKDRRHEHHLKQFGVEAVIPETVEASLQLAGQTLRAAGIADSQAEASLDLYRRQRYS
jgi:CPA2 family monovalent cation:H+ antiporter-2